MPAKTTMKSVKTFAKPIRTEIEELPIPVPGDDEVLIKIEVAGSNPKDWKVWHLWDAAPMNSGDDMAGYVAAVGKNVSEFRPGDRVAGFHEMMTPHGAFAEYGICPAHTTFHIADSTTFEEAATLPLAVGTAFQGLFQPRCLGLPSPLNPVPEGEPVPLVVYGASSAVGAFAVKLAKLAGLGPVVGVCGAGADYARRAGCDHIVDYRRGRVVADIRAALGGLPLRHAFDAVSEHGSLEHLGAVLEPQGRHTVVLPDIKLDEKLAKHVVPSCTHVGDCHSTQLGRDIAFAYFRLVAKWLKEGRLEGHPVKVVPGGLAGVEAGLQALQEGKISAQKQVFRIADTPGL